MSRAPLVGLIGRKRVGKDSVAAVLTEWFGFQRFAFADAVRRAALTSDPFVETDPLVNPGFCERLSRIVAAYGWEKAKELHQVRRYLQNYGMAIREIEPNFWLRQVMSAADDARREGIPAVITDVRFTNEADAVEREGGVLVRIERPSVFDGDSHVSETELATRPTPYTVVNGGTLEELRAAVFKLHESIS